MRVVVRVVVMRRWQRFVPVRTGGVFGMLMVAVGGVLAMRVGRMLSRLV